MREASRIHGIDGILKDHNVDVIIGPGSGTLYSVAAAAGEELSIPYRIGMGRNADHDTGYPIATLPLSYLEENGCPFGLVALASAYQEDILVTVQSAWEATFPARKAPPGLK